MAGSFRRIVAIARKEMLVLLGEAKSRFMVLLPPVIQIFVFAYAATMDVHNVDVLIRDADRGQWSVEVVNRLQGSPTFRAITYADNEQVVRARIDQQQVLCALGFDNAFSRNIERGEPASMQLVLDGRRSNTAQIVTQYLTTIVESVAQTTPRGLSETGGRVELVVVNWFNPNLNFKWFILPNLIGMINLIMGIIITGLTVARERELGTFDQTLVSPATPMEIAIGKLVPGCTVGLVHGSIFLVAAYFFFGVPFVGSLGILYASMLLFSLSVSSLGLMVSSFTSTQQQAFLGCFTIAVPCILLSGFMTPINNMPTFLKYLSELNPLRHFIVILQGVFLKDISLTAAMDSGGKIAAIAVVTAVLAIWMFTRKA